MKLEKPWFWDHIDASYFVYRYLVEGGLLKCKFPTAFDISAYCWWTCYDCESGALRDKRRQKLIDQLEKEVKS